MALQFVFGSSGSGKTHYLYKEAVKSAVENPEDYGAVYGSRTVYDAGAERKSLPSIPIME